MVQAGIDLYYIRCSGSWAISRPSWPSAMPITIRRVFGKGWMLWRQDGRLAQI